MKRNRSSVVVPIRLCVTVALVAASSFMLSAAPASEAAGAGVKVAGVLFSETFDYADIAELQSAGGWQLVDGGAAGPTAPWHTWTIQTTHRTTEHILDDTSPFVIVDSDRAGSYALDESIITPALSTVSWTSLVLSFDYAYKGYSTPNEQGDVDYSINGGATWTNLVTFTTPSTQVIQEYPYSIALPAVCEDVADLRIRFRYHGADYDYWWGVDNVVIDGEVAEGSLTGTVTEDGTGNPAVDVSVTVDGTGYSAVTDINGAYFIGSIQVGTYDVSFAKSGYIPHTEPGIEIYESLTTTVDVTLILSEGPLAGTVRSVGNDNVPVVGATVEIVELSATALTDANGEFDFGIVGSSDLTIVVTPDNAGYSPWCHDGQWTITHTFGTTLDLTLEEILPPEALGANAVDETSVDFSWDPPANHSLLKDLAGNFLGYGVFVDGVLQPYRLNLTSTRIGGLNCGQEYSLNVAADYGYGEEYLVQASTPVTVRAVPTTDGVWEVVEIDYEWIEINPALGGDGAAVPNWGDDENSGWLEWGTGQTFTLYDVEETGFHVCSNGWLSLDRGSAGNTAIRPRLPNSSAPNLMMALLGIDQDTGDRDCGSWWLADSDENVVVVEYHNRYYSNTDPLYIYEAIIRTDDNTVTFSYQTAGDGAEWHGHEPVETGLENADGSEGVVVSNADIDNYTSYRFYHRPPVTEWAAIVGVVTSSIDGSLLENVEVVATSAIDSKVFKATSNAAGEFQVLVDRPLGPYDLQFSHSAFHDHHEDAVDLDPGFNTVRDVQMDPKVDIQVSKDDGVTAAVPGQTTLTYSIVVTGDAVIDLAEVALSDPFPAELRNLELTDIQLIDGTAGPGPGTPTSSLTTGPFPSPLSDTVSLPAGSSIVYTVTAEIDPAARGTLINTATVTVENGDEDYDTSNNTATDDDTVLTPIVDIVVSTTDAPDPVTAGSGSGNLTHTILVSNGGPSDASGVTLNETVVLPVDTSIVSIIPSGSTTYAPPGTSPGVWTVGSLAAGSSEALTVVLTVGVDTPDGATISSTANVTGVSEPDTNSGNDSATEHTTVQTRADLLISTTDAPDPVIAGNSLTYTVTVQNLGPGDAHDVVVTDTLPAGVSNATTAGCAEDANGVPTCTLGTIAVGASKMFSITVDVDSDTIGIITNQANVTSNTVLVNTGDDSVSEDTTVGAEADLVITKSDDVDPIDALQTLTYTIEVANNGPSSAADVVVTDTLPAGVTLVSTSGCAEDASGVPTCTLGSIEVGASKQYTVEVSVDGATSGTITNQASVASSATLINTGDDSTSEDTEVNAVAELAASVLDTPDPVPAGAQLTYTVNLTNSGPGDTADATVYDVLPDGATFVSDTGGCVQPGALIGMRAVLTGGDEVPPVTSPASGEAVFVLDTTTFELHFGIHVAGLGSIITDAHIYSGAAGVNGALVHTLYEGTPLFDDANPVVGVLQLTDAQVSDLQSQPFYVNLLSDTFPNGELRGQLTTTAQTPLECSLGSLTAGGSTGFDVIVQVPVDNADGSTVTNGTIATSSTTDPNRVELPAGHLSGASALSATAVETVADLVISMADSPDPVVAGTALSYTVTVDNNGPSDAQDVVVTDTLPAGVSFLSTNGCAEDPSGMATCTLGSISAGSSSQYTIAVDVDSTTHGTITNQVTVTSSTTEGNPGDESASESTAVVERADLSISMSDSPDPVLAGNQLTYSVRVDNAGPSEALHVVVTDTLPVGVALAATSGCVEDPSGVPTCTLGSIGVGGFASYSITVDVDPAARGVVTNLVTVSTSATDPVSGNDSASEDTTVNAEVDLALVKTDAVDPLPSGDPLVYTLEVTNDGPSDATGVVVTDILPAGVTLGSTSGCAEDPVGAPTCTLGTVGAGATVQYTLTATVDPSPPASIINSASVSAAETDTDPSNDSDDEETTLDTAPPEVTVLNSVNDTGNGVIDECESALVSITEFIVTFSEPMLNPSGNSDPNDVTNPASYLLVATGADGDFSTSVCGGVFGDDLALGINSVLYDSVNREARLLINALPAAQIRVMACGTALQDLAGNPLDGDGDGSGGDDFIVTFRSDPGNRFENGHFDCPSTNLDGWTVSDPVEITRSDDDLNGSQSSGSVQITQLAANTSFEISQCAPVSATGSGDLSAWLRLSTASYISFSAGCEFFATTACGSPGTGIDSSVGVELLADSGGVWLPFTLIPEVPAGTMSARCSFTFGTGTGADFTAWLDNLVLKAEGLIFRDGFETGDTTQWTGSTP